MLLTCYTTPKNLGGKGAFVLELGTRSLIRGSLSAHHLIFSHGLLTLNPSFSGLPVSLIAQSLVAQSVVRSAIKLHLFSWYVGLQLQVKSTSYSVVQGELEPHIHCVYIFLRQYHVFPSLFKI